MLQRNIFFTIVFGLTGRSPYQFISYSRTTLLCIKNFRPTLDTVFFSKFKYFKLKVLHETRVYFFLHLSKQSHTLKIQKRHVIRLTLLLTNIRILQNTVQEQIKEFTSKRTIESILNYTKRRQNVHIYTLIVCKKINKKSYLYMTALDCLSKLLQTHHRPGNWNGV